MRLARSASLNQITVSVFAPVLVLVGVLGFVLPPHLSATSSATPYNIFHIGFGILGIGLAFAHNEKFVRAFCIGFGLIDLYQFVASRLDIFPKDHFQWTKVDDALHLVIGIALIVIGIWPRSRAQVRP